ncbi:MAG: dimethylmenaquinone methyltransferase [Acidobacteria bacterium]|nr:dimethylmenaquinone methyltransferase [Acidobacteriota bacterium]MBI3469861.1 dimethylmenaquinone methyltransferase [Candidatus Solibacter usitatus]
MKKILIAALLLALPAPGQVFRFTREQMLHYTPLNPFERFPDGRPKVPDSLLEKVKGLSIEEAWGLLRAKGYQFQYAGDFKILHPGKKLVGRAVTAQYLPLRPDLGKVLDADAKAAGMPSGANQKVIDLLRPDDVPVIDLMGAAPGHNFGGDNLHAAIYGATRTGAVVDGTIRDVEGIYELPTQVYFKEGHPAAVAGVSVVGINIPVKVGGAIVLPGDVVLGDRTGVIFIPPHLVQEIVDQAELTHIHDEWTKQKFLTGKYKSSELYGGPLSPENKKEYDDYVKKRLAEKK